MTTNHKNPANTTALLGFILTACLTPSLIASTNLQFIVAPQSGAESNSRDAVFNWLIESASGSDARIGQYACGSYWIAPAAGDSGVRLISITGSGIPGKTDLLSMDADPKPHSHGLLSGANNYGSYNATENEIPKLPKVFTAPPNSCVSLVAAMQRNEAETSPGGTSQIWGEVADAYCIITIVSSPPTDNGANSIRPNFVGDTKHFYTWADFDLSKLPSLSFIGSKTPEQIDLERKRWNHSTEVFGMWTWNGSDYNKHSEGGRAYRAHILHDDYGSSWAGTYTDAIISTLGTNSLNEKKPLLASLIAQGMDMYEQRYGRAGYPGAWTSGAGQSSGQANPIFFAVALSNDNAKRDNLKRVAYENWNEEFVLQGPQEMRQIMRGRTGVLLWGDNHLRRPVGTPSYGDEVKRYWGELEARNGFDGAINSYKNGGQKTAADPHGYIDGPPGGPGNDYMATTVSAFRNFAALCLLLPDFGELVNTTDPIEYADRITRQGVWASPDPVAPPTAADQGIADCNPFNNSAACGDYRILWGPSASDWRYPIENGIGRFQSKHGRQISPLGGSVVDANWNTIIGMYNGSKYEDRYNPPTQCTSPDIYIYPDNGLNMLYMRTATPDASIYFTTDGSQPTSSSQLYTTPISISDPTSLKSISIKSGLSNSKVSVHFSAFTNATAPTDPSTLIVPNP